MSRFLVLLFLYLFVGCRKNTDSPVKYTPSQYRVKLVDSKRAIDIPLDRFTMPVTNSLQLVGDTLAFMRDSSILLIDLKKKNAIKAINFSRKSTPGIYDFLIKNSDSVFLVTKDLQHIYLADYNGATKDKFLINNLKGYFYPTYAGSAGGCRMFFQENTLCFNIVSGMPDEEQLQKEFNAMSPTMALNLATRSIEGLAFAVDNKHNWNTGSDPYPSVAFDGKTIVYSFLSNHNVYAFHKEETVTADASSDFFQRFIEPIDSDDSRSFDLYLTKILNGDEYALITYDPYREVYYRFMYIGFTPGVQDNIKQLAYMRPHFTIIILDKKLKKIGETRMPYATHVAFNHFVTADGLYLSNNHFLNKKANEDVLSFSLYTLEPCDGK
jgi:hypothetical protein